MLCFKASHSRMVCWAMVSKRRHFSLSASRVRTMRCCSDREGSEISKFRKNFNETNGWLEPFEFLFILSIIISEDNKYNIAVWLIYTLNGETRWLKSEYYKDIHYHTFSKKIIKPLKKLMNS